MTPVEPGAYEPMTIARLGSLLAYTDDKWRMVAEFLEEYSWEPADVRTRLLADPPQPVGDERWDTFLAALAEHLTAREGLGAPAWVTFEPLRQFWFPFNTAAARVDAIVHGPAAFRSRGIFIAPQELTVV